MPEETNKTNLSEEKNSESTSKPKKEAVPAEDPAGPSPPPAPQPKPAAESTKPAPSKEANPATQALPANKASKPAPETAKEMPAHPEAEAPAAKPSETVELAEEKPVGKPATEAIQAETIKEKPGPKTEQILPAESKAELPPDTATSQAPEPAPSPLQQARGKPKQPEQQLETQPQGTGAGQAPAKDSGAGQLAPPTEATPTPRVEQIPFMTKFKNKLAEFRLLANRKRAEKVKENINKIIAFAKEHNRIDNQDVRELIALKDERAREYLDKLEKQGKLVQFGKKGPKVFYKPIGKL